MTIDQVCGAFGYGQDSLAALALFGFGCFFLGVAIGYRACGR